MELALFNRDLETTGRRDEEGRQVIVFIIIISTIINCYHHHLFLLLIIISIIVIIFFFFSSSLSLSRSWYSWWRTQGPRSNGRDLQWQHHGQSDHIYQSNTVFNFSINNNWNENIIVLTSFNHPVNKSINSRLSEIIIVNNCRCGVQRSTTTSLAFTKSVARSALRSTKRFLSSLFLCHLIIVCLTSVIEMQSEWFISWSICPNWQV